VGGTKTLTATYSGDTDFNGSSDTEGHVVLFTTTTAILSDAPDPSEVNTAYTVSGTVTSTGGTPTGTVAVDDGTGASCSPDATVQGDGTWSCDLTSTSNGTKTLTATYSGDAAFDTSSDTETHEAIFATTTSILSDAPDPSLVSAAYTVSGTVTSTGGTPTGTVAVDDGTGDSCSPDPTVQGDGTWSCSLT